jgi:hypothetical protein
MIWSVTSFRSIAPGQIDQLTLGRIVASLGQSPSRGTADIVYGFRWAIRLRMLGARFKKIRTSVPRAATSTMLRVARVIPCTMAVAPAVDSGRLNSVEVGDQPTAASRTPPGVEVAGLHGYRSCGDPPSCRRPLGLSAGWDPETNPRCV